MGEKNLCEQVVIFRCQANNEKEMTACRFFSDRYEKGPNRDCRFHALNKDCLSEAAQKAASVKASV